MVSLPATAAPHRMPRFLSPSKRGDTNWYRPPQTRYGAHVASQRFTILRSGKAIILSRNAQLMATPKTQIVLDMGYTLPKGVQNEHANRVHSVDVQLKW